jgi:hypothetical protein
MTGTPDRVRAEQSVRSVVPAAEDAQRVAVPARPARRGKAVIVLGAGSSADFGVPTLAGLFKDNHARRYLVGDPNLLGTLRDVFWHPRGHDLESSDKSLTVEEMLTAIRDWDGEPLDEGKKPRDVAALRRKLFVLIYKAVFEGKSSKAAHLNPVIEFCRKTLERTTWASFNWDCMFESSFYYSSGGPGPYERTNPYVHVRMVNWRQGYLSQELLKLHGSISWWIINGQLTYQQWGYGGELARRWADYAAGREGADHPVILEPSAYKYRDAPYEHLEPQWKVFFDRLLEADYVVVIGYSLPEADTMARSKILTSFQVNTRARWLVVDPSEQVCARYRRLLGDRRLTTLQMTLAGFNNELIPNLLQAFPTIPVPEAPGEPRSGP